MVDYQQNQKNIYKVDLYFFQHNLYIKISNGDHYFEGLHPEIFIPVGHTEPVHSEEAWNAINATANHAESWEGEDGELFSGDEGQGGGGAIVRGIRKRRRKSRGRKSKRRKSHKRKSKRRKSKRKKTKKRKRS